MWINREGIEFKFTVLLYELKVIISVIKDVSPWPDAQLCWSPATVVKRCVLHEVSPAKQPCDSASLLLKKRYSLKKILVVFGYFSYCYGYLQPC